MPLNYRVNFQILQNRYKLGADRVDILVIHMVCGRIQRLMQHNDLESLIGSVYLRAEPFNLLVQLLIVVVFCAENHKVCVSVIKRIDIRKNRVRLVEIQIHVCVAVVISGGGSDNGIPKRLLPSIKKQIPLSVSKAVLGHIPAEIGKIGIGVQPLCGIECGA